MLSFGNEKSAFDIKVGLDSTELETNFQTKSKARIAQTAEIFTPDIIARFMLKTSAESMQKYNNRELGDIDVTFLEPSCGNGQFLLHIIATKWDGFIQDLGKNPHKIFAYSMIDNALNEFDFGIKAFCNAFLHSLANMWGQDIMQDNIQQSRENCLDLISRLWTYFYENEIYKPFYDECDFLLQTNLIRCDTLMDSPIYRFAIPQAEGFLIKENVCVFGSETRELAEFNKPQEDNTPQMVCVKKPYIIESWAELKDLQKIYTKGYADFDFMADYYKESTESSQESQENDFTEAHKQGRLF